MRNRVTGAAPSSAAAPAATAAAPRAAPKPAPRPAPAPVRAAPAPAPAPAAPPKAAPAPAAAAAPASRSSAAPISWGPWLLSQFRLVLHLLLVLTTGWITYEALQIVIGEEPDHTAAMLLGGFGLAVLLGFTSLVTIFLGRRIHPALSKLFFGLTIFMILLALFAASIIDGWTTWSGENPVQCIVTLSMLGCSVLALGTEALCRRLGVVTRWQVPWSGG